MRLLLILQLIMPGVLEDQVKFGARPAHLTAADAAQGHLLGCRVPYVDALHAFGETMADFLALVLFQQPCQRENRGRSRPPSVLHPGASQLQALPSSTRDIAPSSRTWCVAGDAFRREAIAARGEERRVCCCRRQRSM
ncbi:hypothetical protein CF165_07335 [Amycolatopsis vastitatis]|uniref:Uncharacterized protein n=1 Tax=Amycolatopsis vastitatis TaxID=1905142 RepID=A0A229TDL8_9PSEU|nr:hypothetical protein CF165_07335 [Amycolatopsis vastitatis]